MSDFQRSCAETVTLLSARTDSTWSFACRSARRMERVWQILRDYDDDAPPFHSFSESALFSESAVRIDLEQTDTLIDEVDFDDLPDWSDVEEEPDYNTRYKRDANVFPLTSTTPADVTCTNDTLIVPGVQFLQMVAMEKKRKKTDEIEDGTPTKRQKLRSNKGGGMGQRRWPRGTQSRSPGFARIRTRHQGQC
ncbi:hypothetical protein GQ44DRAFT_709199 [Phaeosphaeriaceae sp. PMI808]|nr:hypothetical protein GQ44DRAFT_709199 [Phaeosphaeriaceae sp. PMI808]